MNKTKFAFPAIMVAILVLSVVSTSVAYAAPIEASAVSVEKVSPIFVKDVISPSIRPAVKAETIVPIGRFDKDTKDDSENVEYPASLSCAFVDFNTDGKVDTRDMLAYLNAWASKDLSADINGDGVVNTTDYNIFTSSWKICQSPVCAAADFNRDNVIDTRDILSFLNAWTSKDQSADMNGDGLVSGIDFTTFFSTWRKCNI